MHILARFVRWVPLVCFVVIFTRYIEVIRQSEFLLIWVAIFLYVIFEHIFEDWLILRYGDGRQCSRIQWAVSCIKKTKERRAEGAGLGIFWIGFGEIFICLQSALFSFLIASLFTGESDGGREDFSELVVILLLVFIADYLLMRLFGVKSMTRHNKKYGGILNNDSE